MDRELLSKPQISVLQNILKNVNKPVKKQTIEALRWRGFIDDSKILLTQQGFNKAIESLSLEEQCGFLNIQLHDILIHRANRYPENDAKLYFEKDGYEVIRDETGSVIFGNILTAIILDILKTHYKEKYSFASENEVNTFYITLSPFVHLASLGKELVKHIVLESNANRIDEKILEYYQYVTEYWTNKGYENANSANEINARISQMANKILNKNHFTEYIDNYLIDTGWPDLVLVKDNNIQLVEIKTTDKLHMSQIIQIQNIKKFLPFDVKVVRLIKQKI